MKPEKSSGLQEAIIVFNLLPATYADPSWFDAPVPWSERLASLRSPAARAAASDWLLARYAASDRFDFEFSQVDKALFLLSPHELQALAAKVGLIRYRAELRHVIAGGLLARLGSELGAAAVQQALAGPPAPASLPAADAPLDRQAPALRPQLMGAGLPWLFGFLRPEWQAVAVRARLKFPRALAQQVPLTLEESEREAGLDFLHNHLLQAEAA